MNIPRLIRTVRYLKAQQILMRMLRKIQPVRFRAPIQASVRIVPSRWVMPVTKRKSMVGTTQFEILNRDFRLEHASDWNRSDDDKLTLYHLHYFDDLNAESTVERRSLHRELVERWIDENPPVSGNGWEPYPLSLRIVNWIKWQMRESSLSHRALESLYAQARVLYQTVEYHLLANHILANAKALCFAGYFFEGNEAASWLRRGRKILDEQLEEQILDDGGHFELSPMYHSIVLEDVLDLVNLLRAYDDGAHEKIGALVSGMLHWLALMTHPDGALSYFNDSTSDVAATLSALEDYAVRLGIDVPLEAQNGIRSLPQSGFVRFDDDDLAMIIDVGRLGPDYQPGHGHCDCLSFELSRCSNRVLVNTGISTYKVCDRRMVERGTSSHNTVSVNSSEQSEIWSAFRAGRRAFPVDVSVGDTFVSAGHDGYSHVGITHHRDIRFAEGSVRVLDEVSSRHPERVPATAHWHFHPDVTVKLEGARVEAGGLVLEFSGHQSVRLADYEYCRGFNRTATSTAIDVVFTERLLTTIKYANTHCF